MSRSVWWHNVPGDLSLSALLLSRWKLWCLSQPRHKNSSQLSHLPEQLLFWAPMCRRYCAYWLAGGYCSLRLLGNILLVIITGTNTEYSMPGSGYTSRLDWYKTKRRCKKKVVLRSHPSQKRLGASLTLAVNKVLGRGRLTPFSNDTAVPLKVITCNQGREESSTE